MIASLKSDKDALETTLYETQQLNAQLETRKDQLEGENQEIILKKENLTGNRTNVVSFSLTRSESATLHHHHHHQPIPLPSPRQ